MALIASFQFGCSEVLAARLDTRDEAVRDGAAWLSQAERLRAAKFARECDRRRFVAARARLRQLIGERLDLRPEKVELVYGERGKPALAPRLAASGLRFNLSHCGEVAVYAFASGREIGVDVEALRPLPDADDVAARFFSPKEYEAYRSLEPRLQPLGFFNCWTRKEAFIKALGEGLYYPLSCFDVSLAPGERARILRVETMPGERCGWGIESFSPTAGFVAAVVYAQQLSAATAAGARPRAAADKCGPAA
jgi:4'-phosphopantetheinyl transferase